MNHKKKTKKAIVILSLLLYAGSVLFGCESHAGYTNPFEAEIDDVIKNVDLYVKSISYEESALVIGGVDGRHIEYVIAFPLDAKIPTDTTRMKIPSVRISEKYLFPVRVYGQCTDTENFSILEQGAVVLFREKGAQEFVYTPPEDINAVLENEYHIQFTVRVQAVMATKPLRPLIITGYSEEYACYVTIDRPDSGIDVVTTSDFSSLSNGSVIKVTGVKTHNIKPITIKNDAGIPYIYVSMGIMGTNMEIIEEGEPPVLYRDRDNDSPDGTYLTYWTQYPTKEAELKKLGKNNFLWNIPASKTSSDNNTLRIVFIIGGFVLVLVFLFRTFKTPLHPKSAHTKQKKNHLSQSTAPRSAAGPKSMIDRLNDYCGRLREKNIRDSLSESINLLDEIEKVTAKEEIKDSSTEKLYSNVIPPVLKLLGTYVELGEKKVQSKHTAKLKKEIADAIDTFKRSLFKIYEDIMEQSIMNVLVEIDALENYLALSGLLDDGLPHIDGSDKE